MAQRRVGFTVTVGLNPRLLMFAFEEKSNDLYVFLRSGLFDRKVNTKSITGNINTQKFSVHPTKNNPELNVIKQYLNAGDERTSVIMTKAIKNGSKFAYLFTWRTSDLSDRHYDMRKCDFIQNIGSFDPSKQTLFIGLLVGAPNHRFRLGWDDNVSAHQMRFRNYRLVILHSVLNFPSSPTGHFIHRKTVDPTTLEGNAANDMKKAIDGHTDIDCLNIFKSEGEILVRRYRELIYSVNN